MGGAADTLGHFREGIDTTPKPETIVLERVSNNVVPEGLTPDDRTIRIESQTFVDAILKGRRIGKEDEGDQEEWDKEEAVAKEGGQKDKEEEGDPSNAGKRQEEHGNENTEEKESG